MNIHCRVIFAYIMLALTNQASASCQIVNTVCAEPAATRMIDGFPIYRDCWRYESLYGCDGGVTMSQQCLDLQAQGCVQTGSTCTVTHPSGFCSNYDIAMQCSSTSAARTVQLCGDTMTCPGGDCTAEYQTYDQSSQNFTKAATAMEAAAEIVKEGIASYNATGTFYIFSGRRMECDDAVLGTFNCCSGSGWAEGLGLVDCNSEEVTLGLAREAGEAHYVGSYCSNDSIVGCLTTSQVYCVYPSKLGRIIIEQANADLGIGYGTPTATVCTGLTQAQFETLDMSGYDFTEFTGEVMQELQNAGVPDATILIDRVNQNLQYMSGP